MTFHPFYQLDEIIVSEGSLIDSSSVRGEVIKKEYGSLVNVSTYDLKRNLKDQFPGMESLHVKKNFPRDLIIGIEEREKKALWCLGREDDYSDCFEIDSKGILFQNVDPNDDFEEVLLIEYHHPVNANLGDRALPQKKTDFIFFVEEKLKEDLEKYSNMAIIPHSRSLFMEIKDPQFRIKFDFEDSPEDQIERLTILMEEKIDNLENISYIDLRYGNQVFYK